MALETNHQRQSRRANVRGMGEHLRHRQHAMGGVKVVDGELSVAQAVARVHMRPRLTLPDSSAIATDSALKVEPIS